MKSNSKSTAVYYYHYSVKELMIYINCLLGFIIVAKCFAFTITGILIFHPFNIAISI